MKFNTILVRVSKLPVGSLIEIEFICDSAKIEQSTKVWKTDSTQILYESFENFKNERNGANDRGEIFYCESKV